MTNCHILYINGNPYAILKTHEQCSHLMAMLQDTCYGTSSSTLEIKPAYLKDLPF